MLENFHKKLLYCKFPQQIVFFGKGTQQFAFKKKKFTKKISCDQTSTKYCVVWKYPHKIYLWKKFQKKKNLQKIFHNTLLCRKMFAQKLLFFLISTKLRFFGKLSQLALKLLCNTPNEVFVESIGSVLENTWNPKDQGNNLFLLVKCILIGMVQWSVMEDNVLARSLDRKFGSRKKWNFKSGNTKFYTSAVIDLPSGRYQDFKKKLRISKHHHYSHKGSND